MSGDPEQARRDRQRIELALKAPHRRPIAGGGRFLRAPVPQDDVDGLALFDAARSPTLI